MRGHDHWLHHHLFSLAALAMKENMADVGAILCEAATVAASHASKPEEGLSQNGARKANLQ